MPPFVVRLSRRLSCRDRTRGAAAVEAAIVLPVVLLLFVGILEFGLIFKDALAISSGVRAGGRIASAEPLKLSFARDAATQVGNSMSSVNTTGVSMLYVYDPGNDPTKPIDPRTSCTTKCVRYLWNTATSHFDAQRSSWDQCATGSTQVSVMLSVQHKGLTSAPYASPTLVETAVFAFEPASSTATCQ
ncbi:MAG: pilus assembly protein [Actinomycetota bacterium]|nr:pilus assembly protein [Actinomycetota bacterium]